MKRLSVLVTGATAYLVLAAAAFAQSPVRGGYGGQGGVGNDVAGQGADVGVAGGGTLPFTGMDLLMLLAVAAVLVAAGFAVRRAARQTS